MPAVEHLSPDTDTFSTPPTTPGLAMEQIRPSLSRRGSRPTSIHINPGEWNSGIVVEESSPRVSRKQDGALSPSNNAQDPSTTPRSSLLPSPAPPPVPQSEPIRPSQYHPEAIDSPCFVHSHLDKGASLSEWLRNKQHAFIGDGDVGVSKSLQAPNGHVLRPPTSPTATASDESDEDENTYRESLTKQLAETAVSVREMSKQLGRARVHSNIQTVLIVTKARDNRLIKLTRELAIYLMLKPRKGQKRGLVVYVDTQLRHSRRFDAEGIRRDHPDLFVPLPRRRTSSSNSLSSLSSASTTKDESYSGDDGQLRYWTSSMCSHSPHLFDFVVTLGGDGTVLFTSWLFQRIVPPVLPFALGSLGFLTNFDFNDYQAVMDSALDTGIRVNLRMRFTCTVYRAVSNQEGKRRKAVKKGETGEILMKNVEKGGWEALEGGWSGGFSMPDVKSSAKDKEIMCFTTRPVETFEVLNDLVVDRGPSPYVSLLELFGDDHHMTTVQADGLTVSTPTGSTAYSLSAGGSLVHPEIPAILITPICPHTLSFRPMLLPDSMELRICVPYNSRSTAWASFDGRGRVELKQGDHIKVTASKYPFPTVCAGNQSTDWFHSISRTLKWNERERQKSFVVVEETGPSKRKKRSKRGATTADQKKVTPPEAVDESAEHMEEEDEVSDEEEEEETFDIDDSSPEAMTLDASLNALTPEEERLGQEKTNETLLENTLHKAVAASAVEKDRRRKSGSRSRSGSTSTVSSGVDSPGRFAGPQPHLPPRHVDFHLDSSRDMSEERRSGQEGARDDIHSPRPLSGRSRIPRDRDIDLDNVRTPTASMLSHRRTRHYPARSRSMDRGPRAFAVWGHDESDSNASDSSAGE
ncbi:putative ATP-NAD kinase [Lyophyllum shimeji]|uniref:ATP-NAD kinase n=1 Tax=Lyophyllum shimeji TaxID=47721 RepID=A0A9P3UNF0_LYOSH|nr:putative ATP-NAD kinase [Lyophyllum shimeji]